MQKSKNLDIGKLDKETYKLEGKLRRSSDKSLSFQVNNIQSQTSKKALKKRAFLAIFES